MRGEEGQGTDAVVQMLGDAPGDAQAVVGAGAAPDLVEDNEALRGGVMDDVGRFVHLHQEGGLAAGEVVARADAGEDAVHEAELGCGGGQGAADLRHEDQESGLAEVGGFTGHVRAGENDEPVFVLI